jgi:drug/metabolite transporter (DMT)-like permease
VLGAAFAFSAMGALVKVAGREVPALEAVFFRSLVTLVIVYVLARRSGVPLRGTHRGLLLLRALVGTVAIILLFWAVLRIPVADAILLNQATPIFVLPLAAIFLGERLRPLHVLLALGALAGAGLVIRPTGAFVNVAGLVALGSAFFAALAYVLLRPLSQREHAITVVFWYACVSTLVPLPLMVPGFVWPSASTLLALLGVGVMATTGQLLLTWAYRQGEAGRLAVVGSTGALFGALWDYALSRHLPDGLTVAGAVLLIACSAAVQWTGRTPRAPELSG